MLYLLIFEIIVFLVIKSWKIQMTFLQSTIIFFIDYYHNQKDKFVPKLYFNKFFINIYSFLRFSTKIEYWLNFITKFEWMTKLWEKFIHSNFVIWSKINLFFNDVFHLFIVESFILKHERERLVTKFSYSIYFLSFVFLDLLKIIKNDKKH